MKKLLTLFLCLASLLAIGAQKKYSLTFDKNDFSYSESAKGYTINCKGDKYYLLDDILLPALPYTSISVIIPDGMDIANLTVSKTDYEVMKNIYISNNPLATPPSKLPTQPLLTTVYPNSRYPDVNVKLVSKSTMQGFTYVSFIVCPFIYDATNKKLNLISNLDISFDYVPTSSLKASSTVAKRYDMADEIKQFVLNPNEISTLYSTATTVTSLKSASSDVNYLIITSDDLVTDFVPLKAWKIQKGIRAEIISTGDIYKNYAGATNQLKIKNCLLDYYNNRNLQWVLLGGDNTKVPVQGCYGKKDEYIDDKIPCDLFYACFNNTFNWDNDGDGVIGETTDDIDMAPEIFISRLPVRTPEHVRAITAKTLDYEQNPVASNYVKTMLLTGTQLWGTINNLSDLQGKSEVMYKYNISPYWTGTKKMFYDTGTDFTGNASYDLTRENLLTQLNSGFHFVHMGTHGSQTGWSMEIGDEYNTAYAERVANVKKSVIVTMSCNTNAFDDSYGTNDPCLSEAFIRNPNGGCVLYWGSSRYGWDISIPITSELGPSFKYNARFFKRLFTGVSYNQSFNFGAITNSSKYYYTPQSAQYGAYRWLQFSLNAIGDPELSIYTEDPSTFSNASVTQNDTTVTVNTGSVEGCTIALTSRDYGATLFEVKSDVSTATFNNVSCPYYVTITKHNYKPFIYPENIYIQNYSFNSDEYVAGKNIYVGYNVSPTLPLGNVTVKDGANATFDATENLFFNNGFSIELGGSIEVLK